MNTSARLTLLALLLFPACAKTAEHLVPSNFDVNIIKSTTPDQGLADGLGTVSHTDDSLNVPTFTWADETPADVLAKRAAMTHEEAARAYLGDYAPRYRLGRRFAAEAVLKAVHDTGAGPVIVQFKQHVSITDAFGSVRFVDVFRDEMKLLMRRDHSLVAISGYLHPVAQTADPARHRFDQTDDQALAFALSDLTGLTHVASDFIANPTARGGYAYYSLGASSIFSGGSSFRARPTLFAVGAELEPAYYLELEVAAETTSADAFAYVISAVDGRLLMRRNLTDYEHSFRVYADADGVPLDSPEGDAYLPHPTAQPDGLWPNGVVESRLLVQEHGPISTGDPWIPAGVTALSGNNAHAYADTAAPNGLSAGDVEINESDEGVYDYAFNANISADASIVQIKAATTNMFFIVNFLHDWFYDAGFKEADGNGQSDNYGRGGAGDDALLVEGQDFSGRNNANMATFADGKSPRMQMYMNDTPSLPVLLLEGNTAIPLARVATVPFAPAQYAPVLGLVVTVQSTDACVTFTNAVDLQGRFALVKAASCELHAAAVQAELAGARALIVIAKEPLTTRQLAEEGDEVGLPVLVIEPSAGATLEQTLASGQAVFATSQRGAPADRDAAFESATVSHEWGHYLSNRLVGDASGLSTRQANSMGEGWGDFVALLLTVKEADATLQNNSGFSGAYPLFSYTSTFDPTSDIYYRGLRRAPYSTNFQINPLTFKHVSNGVALPPIDRGYNFGASGANNAEVHNAGEVWAAMLWECYVALLGETARGLSFADKQLRMKRYLVESLKMTPNGPTFLEARDAVLAAALATDSVDYELFWNAFARRGAGVRSIGPARDSTDNANVHESFVVGPDLAIVSASLGSITEQCTPDGLLDNGESAVLTLTVKNVGSGDVTPIAIVGSATPGLGIAGAGIVNFPTLTPMKSATSTVLVRANSLSSLSRVDLTISASAPNLLVGGVTKTISFMANYDVAFAASANDDVEAPQSAWVPTHVNAEDFATDDFVRVSSTAEQSAWFGADVDAPSDMMLTSPALQVSATKDFVVHFRHAYSFEKGKVKLYDGGVVELSTDGTTWTDLGAQTSPGYGGTIEESEVNPLSKRAAFVGKSLKFPALQEAQISLGTTYAGQTVFLRFRIGSDESAGAAGWTIDDLRFDGIDNTPFTTRVANVCQ